MFYVNYYINNFKLSFLTTLELEGYSFFIIIFTEIGSVVTAKKKKIMGWS